MACNTVVMRALSARGMPRAAVTVTLFTVCCNLALGVALMRAFSHRGLAIGTSCAFTGAALLGASLLARDLGRRLEIFRASWLARQLVCCALFAAGLYFVVNDVPYPVAAPLSHRAIWMLAIVAIGILLYTAITTFARCPEWNWIAEALGRKKTDGR
jgi:putative peptidoglycan lipid II flippase